MVDSAGVQLALNEGPVWSESDRWTIDQEPTLDIGGNGSGPAFDGVVGIGVLGDGRLVVGDRGSNSLLLLSPAGKPVSSIGGEGEGPGEFTALARLWVSEGDTLTALNVPDNRITKFDAAGVLLGTLQIPHTPRAVRHVLGTAADGGFWVVEVPRSKRSKPTAEPFRETNALVSVDSSGAVVDTITEFPGIESYVALINRQRRSVPTVRNVLFGRKPILRATRDRLYIADTDRYEIQVWDREGRLVQLIRKEHAPVEVTADHVARANDARREDLEANRFIPETIRRAEMEEIDNTPHRSTFPAFQSFEVDAQGNLWVREYDIDPSSPPAYDVFDAAGIFLGTVSMPRGLTRLNLQADYVLGVWRDELEVEHVRRYEISKPE